MTHRFLTFVCTVLFSACPFPHSYFYHCVKQRMPRMKMICSPFWGTEVYHGFRWDHCCSSLVLCVCSSWLLFCFLFGYFFNCLPIWIYDKQNWVSDQNVQEKHVLKFPQTFVYIYKQSIPLLFIHWSWCSSLHLSCCLVTTAKISIVVRPYSRFETERRRTTLGIVPSIESLK